MPRLNFIWQLHQSLSLRSLTHGDIKKRISVGIISRWLKTVISGRSAKPETRCRTLPAAKNVVDALFISFCPFDQMSWYFSVADVSDARRRVMRPRHAENLREKLWRGVSNPGISGFKIFFIFLIYFALIFSVNIMHLSIHRVISGRCVNASRYLLTYFCFCDQPITQVATTGGSLSVTRTCSLTAHRGMWFTTN